MGIPGTDPSQAPMPSMWSIPFNGNPPLASESTQWCQKWAAKEPSINTTGDSLPACPCTLQQARADVGAFEPDPWCNQDSEAEDKCPHRNEVVHCVRAQRSRYVVGLLLLCSAASIDIKKRNQSNSFTAAYCLWEEKGCCYSGTKIFKFSMRLIVGNILENRTHFIEIMCTVCYIEIMCTVCYLHKIMWSDQEPASEQKLSKTSALKFSLGGRGLGKRV